MKLKVDQKADALYLRLSDSKIVESEQVAPGVIVDFDSRENVVGVEILDISLREAKLQARKKPAPSALVREKPTRKYGN